MSDCTCPLAGYCGRHKVTKGERWYQLCQTRSDYRDKWDSGCGPGQEVPQVVRVDRESKREQKRQLTRDLWAELHSKENPNQKWFKGWLLRVPSFGCSCQDDFRKYVTSNPPDFAEGWYRWTIAAHNFVNAKLQKPIWPIDSQTPTA